MLGSNAVGKVGSIIIASLVLAASVPASAGPVPKFVSAAVADKGRPAEDVARDGARKPAEMLAFAGVRPGAKVGELLPGGGYFTRVLAKAVGPKGRVYAFVPKAMMARAGDRLKPVLAAHSNVTQIAYDEVAAPEPLDLVWTSQNYHDLHLRGGNARKINAEVFAALKPGGTYLVIDHRAAPGTGTADVDTLHRIDEAAVISEVLKAGFMVDDEDMSLRRAEDDHTRKVTDLHDATDQMVLRFRKPR